MRLSDYTDKLFNFLAEKLGRLAEILRVKRPPEPDSFDEENDALPPADWLERIKDIPPEQWINVSGAVADTSAAVLSGSNPAIEESAVSAWDQRKTKEDSSNERFSDNASTKPLRPKSELSFLHFEKPTKKALDQIAESSNRSPVPTQEALTESKGSSVLPKRGMGPMPSSPISDKKPKPSPMRILRTEVGEKPSDGKEVNSDFKQNNPVEKTYRAFASEMEDTNQKKNKIVDKSVFSKMSPFEEPSGMDLDVRPLENADEMTGAKTLMNPIFAPKAKLVGETTSFFPVRNKNAATEPDYMRQTHGELNGRVDDDFRFAAQPWIDLPGGLLLSAVAQFGASRSEAEHLHYLEREQAGWKRNMD